MLPNIYFMSYLCHMTILPMCCADSFNSRQKYLFSFFLSFMQICRLDIFAVLKHLHFPNIPIGV